MKRSDLTPAMRVALFGARPGQTLRGLVHGATLNALARKGLVEGAPRVYGDDYDYVLTDAGVEARDMLRERVERLVAAEGYVRRPDWAPRRQLYVGEGSDSTSLIGAMHRTGVSP